MPVVAAGQNTSGAYSASPGNSGRVPVNMGQVLTVVTWRDWTAEGMPPAEAPAARPGLPVAVLLSAMHRLRFGR